MPREKKEMKAAKIESKTVASKGVDEKLPKAKKAEAIGLKEPVSEGEHFPIVGIGVSAAEKIFSLIQADIGRPISEF